MTATRTLVQAEGLHAVLDDLADSVLVRHSGCSSLALVGIQRRGVHIASALKERLEKRSGMAVPMGSLDITLYRDDWTVSSAKPSVGQSRILFDVADKTLILVDDVLFTGRTIKAALEALVDYGRPRRIELLALVDRGHRELPIQPDFVGLRVETALSDRVDVLVPELDGKEGVCLVTA